MGRKKNTYGNNKSKISITILPEINLQLEDLKINKSKLINWLLVGHFNKII